MTINRTDAKDFAISRFAVDVDDWLDNALSEVCGGDPNKLQTLYDARAQAQLEADKQTPEWAAATGDDDWDRYVASGLPTLAELQPPPPPPPPLPPLSVHIAWLRAALAEAGKLDAVNAAVATAGPVKAQLWDYATTITRNDPDVVAIAAALQINLDEIFARAIEIRDTRAA